MRVQIVLYNSREKVFSKVLKSDYHSIFDAYIFYFIFIFEVQRCYISYPQLQEMSEWGKAFIPKLMIRYRPCIMSFRTWEKEL